MVSHAMVDAQDARTRVHPAHPRRSPPATHQADPGVLLLDEPTSGLDSSSAFVVARLLSAVDSLLLLSRGTVLHHGSLASFDAALLSHGFAIPAQLNPLEYALEVID
ncbi:ABC transporter G family member 4-like [Hordeum vulgare]|nr:ABC transporter G family member 4-like [Hordeum vulgare]